MEIPAPAAPRPTPARSVQNELQALDDWAQWCGERERDQHTARARAGSRQARLAARGAAECLTAERAAVFAWLASDRPTAAAERGRVCAVLATRPGWESDAISGRLLAAGVEVLAVGSSGPRAAAAVLCEHPDLLITEEWLTVIGARELLARTGRFARRTQVCVLADREVSLDLLAAGASLVVSRRQGPERVGELALDLLDQPTQGRGLAVGAQHVPSAREGQSAPSSAVH